MKVINQTKWDTAALRKIVARIAAVECEPEKRKRLVITIKPARQQRGVSGHAWVRGRHSQINVPTKVEEFPAIKFAATVAHELAHNHGHRGERWMRASIRYGHRGDDETKRKRAEFYAWVLEPEYAVRKKLPRAPDPHEKLTRALAKAEKKAAEWRRKLALATTKAMYWARLADRLRTRIPPSASTSTGLLETGTVARTKEAATCRRRIDGRATPSAPR